MRDYRLTGQDVLDAGLTAADWYHTDVPRAQMKALMQKSNGPGLRDTAILFCAMALFAGLGIALWGTWAAVPFWLAYGVLYGSAMDSRWHECGHNTAFESRTLNAIVYHIASFCMIRNPVTWKYSHVRHHTDTIIVGRDPEILAMRPPAVIKIGINFLGLTDAWHSFARMLLNATGRLATDEMTWIPQSQQAKVILIARIWTAIYATTLALAIIWQSWIPLMLIGLPRLYGAWHHVMTGLLQHTGLAEDVLDHRLNTRTVYMNPISRFIYWNMNYHVEHHMFPMVPYHNLPKLHEAIKHDLPAPAPSIAAGFAEIWPILKRQLAGEDVWLKRALPATAKPYREDLHQAVPGLAPH